MKIVVVAFILGPMLYLYPLPRTVEEILERLKVLPSDHKRSQTLPRANFKNHHLDNESYCLSVTKSEYGKNLGAEKKGQKTPKSIVLFPGGEIIINFDAFLQNWDVPFHIQYAFAL